MTEKPSLPFEKAATPDDKLILDTFEHDEEPFIVVDTKLCRDCARKPCLYVCPAQVYRVEGGELVYNIEGCMELGACVVVCREIGNNAIRWNYPRGGYGVDFKHG